MNLRQVFIPTAPQHTHLQFYLTLNGPWCFWCIPKWPSVIQKNLQKCQPKLKTCVPPLATPRGHMLDLGASLLDERAQFGHFHWGVFVWSPSLGIETSSTALLTRAILRQSTHPALLQKSFAICSLYLTASNREICWESSHRAPRDLESRQGKCKGRILGWKSQTLSP